MKDTVITAERKKKEIRTLLICFAIAYAVNIYSIIRFQSSWVELFSQIGFVCAITIFLYVLTIIFRIVVFYTRKLFSRKS